jgi:hypothetical protein
MPDFEPDVEMDMTDDAPDSDSPEQEVDEAYDPDLEEDEGDDADETPDGDDDDIDVDEYDDTIEDEDAEKAPATGRSPAFDKLLAKYGGDYDAMAAAYFEQANSTSKLYREFQELKEVLSRKEADPKAAEEFIRSDPYVKEVQAEMGSIQQEAQRIQQEQYTLIQQYGQLETTIKGLEGELKRADEVDAVTIRQDLSEHKAAMKEALRDFNSNKRELAQLDRTARGVQRTLRDAEARARARMDNENKAKLTEAQTAQLAGRDFLHTINSEMERYGIPQNSQKYKFVRTIVRDRLFNHMSQMNPNDPAIDIEEATRYLMQEAAEHIGLQPAKFQKVSNLKRGAVTPQRNARAMGYGGKKAPPTDPTGKYWSAEYAMKRAEKLLG